MGTVTLLPFGGNVKEVAPLASCLTNQGYKVFCPNLIGHTGRRKDFQGVSYNDWIASAEEGL